MTVIYIPQNKTSEILIIIALIAIGLFLIAFYIGVVSSTKYFFMTGYAVVVTYIMVKIQAIFTYHISISTW
jgi:hypothetical protein